MGAILDLDSQKKILVEMMDAIHCFCKSHSIKYYLTGGTLLGAVRHQGFIPWDDDIDIAMPRVDYERFLKEFKETDRYKVVCLNNSPGYYLQFSKIIDKRTKLVENISNPLELGVFIDIFPMDYVSDSLDFAKSLYKQQKKYLNLLALKNVKVNRNRSVWKNVILFFSKLFISRRYVLKKIDAIAQTCSSAASSKYSAIMVMMTYGEKEIMESSWFKNVIPWKFEGRMFDIPEKYHEVLTHFYSDYMQLPPEEKRVSHHSYQVFWKE